MKALIIDDSRLARRELKHLLKDFSSIEILGEAANADEAIEKIDKLNPGLIFLDIQMPGKTGFELLEALEDAPEVIFTTAYDNYAMKAFDYNALDYLQKPIALNRLAASIAKVHEKVKAVADKKSEVGSMSEDRRVFVKDGEMCWFVRLGDVRLFEVSGNYTTIYFEANKPMIPRTLNHLESKLDKSVFFRANRQQIVNLKWIDKIEPWFSGSIKITLKGGEEIETSRRQAIRFKELMSF
jgi:two-component system LytT family response regulator